MESNRDSFRSELEQAKQGNVIAYKFKGKRFDCGSVDGFVEATNYFYQLSGEDK